MYILERTNRFKKDFKLCIKKGLDIKKLYTILNILQKGEPISQKFKDHQLVESKEFKNCRELHIEPDWLLIYKYNNEKIILILVRTGTHSDLFK